MPNKKVLEKKKQAVSELAEKMKKAKMVVFTKYIGISVEDDTNLRRNIRESNNDYAVIPNSIISHAAKECGIEGLDDALKGPTAVGIGYEDYISCPKAINEYIKDNHDFYEFKAGIMDGKVIDLAEVKKLANLPSKEVLQSMLASALLGNIRNLAVVLDQTRQSKEA